MTWNFWLTSRTMPYAGNCDHLNFRQHTVDNPVWRQNDLTNIFILLFGDNPSDPWELFKHIRFGHEAKTKRFGYVAIVGRDEGYNIAQIVARMP
jgi:hypothetical protein